MLNKKILPSFNMHLLSNIIGMFCKKTEKVAKNNEEEKYRFVFDNYAGNHTNYYKFIKVIPVPLLNYLVNIIDEQKLEDGEIGRNMESGELSSMIVKDTRRAKVGWLPKTDEFLEIYKLLFELLHKCNSEFYHFHLSEIIERIQYTVYNSSDQGHYDWHLDTGPGKQPNRKLSLVCHLSDPNEYEGGELQIHTGKIATPEREKGTVIIFPSYLLHRVTPVTKGIRRTLVMWVNGPSFT
jgi:PKHD-type hydroxylase